MDEKTLTGVLGALEEHGVRYVVVGAFAMTVHGLIRATEDLDLFVAPDVGNIASLKDALMGIFDDPALAEISADDLAGDYPSVRYVPPSGTFYLDIMTRLGEAFAYADLESVRVPFGALMVTVATPAMLYRMKRDTVRLKDRADAAMLRERFKLESD